MGVVDTSSVNVDQSVDFFQLPFRSHLNQEVTPCCKNFPKFPLFNHCRGT